MVLICCCRSICCCCWSVFPVSRVVDDGEGEKTKPKCVGFCSCIYTSNLERIFFVFVCLFSCDVNFTPSCISAACTHPTRHVSVSVSFPLSSFAYLFHFRCRCLHHRFLEKLVCRKRMYRKLFNIGIVLFTILISTYKTMHISVTVLFQPIKHLSKQAISAEIFKSARVYARNSFTCLFKIWHRY